MIEWYWFISFLLISILALILAIYPLYKGWLRSGLLGFGFLTVLYVAYGFWGNLSALQAFKQQQYKQQQAQAILKQLPSPQILIDKLKARLTEDPSQPEGWYLLGRVYLSQTHWQQACDAFAKARQLAPYDDKMTINYAYALWQLNHQVFNDSIRKLYQQVLKKHQDQPDALAMLAMDAFSKKAYSTAISYWESLLALLPPTSNEAKTIRKAIAKAQRLNQINSKN